MSGLDYTKKTELSNGVEGLMAPSLPLPPAYKMRRQRVTLGQKIALQWYRFSFLSRTRGEKWLFYFCILTSLAGLGITLYTIKGINTPVPIEIICPKADSETLSDQRLKP